MTLASFCSWTVWVWPGLKLRRQVFLWWGSVCCFCFKFWWACGDPRKSDNNQLNKRRPATEDIHRSLGQGLAPGLPAVGGEKPGSVGSALGWTGETGRHTVCSEPQNNNKVRVRNLLGSITGPDSAMLRSVRMQVTVWVRWGEVKWGLCWGFTP